MNDRLLQPCPANRALAKAAAVPLAHLSQQRAHARVVWRERLCGPQQLGVPPVRPAFSQLGGTTPARSSSSGINRSAVVLGFPLELLCVGLLAHLARDLSHAQQPTKVPEIITDNVILSVPQKLPIGHGVGFCSSSASTPRAAVAPAVGILVRPVVEVSSGRGPGEDCLRKHGPGREALRLIWCPVCMMHQ